MASYGKNFKISVFGQSHGETIGAVAENFPVGFCPDLDELKRFMERRASRSSLTTPRREGDKVEIVSGLNADGKTCGAPICAIIKMKILVPPIMEKSSTFRVRHTLILRLI